MRNRLLICCIATNLICSCGGGGGDGGSSGSQANAACLNARAVISSGGALSAVQQQQLQVYSAQLNQGVTSGVGAQQVAAEIERYRQSLIQANLNAANATISQSC